MAVSIRIVYTLCVVLMASRGYLCDDHKPPNILLIMADDLGMGDIGCFGNDTIRTPNIDQLARDGVKLTHHLTAASICTPSRAAFMTGRYPIRYGMVPLDFVRVNFFLSSTSGLPPDELTIGEIARKQGYNTGFIGKWHLGLHCSNSDDFCHHPNNQGFDYYFGVPLTNLRDFGPDRVSVIRVKMPFIDGLLCAIFLGGIILAIALKRSQLIGNLGAVLLIMLCFSPMAFIYTIIYGIRYWSGVVMRNTDVVEQPIDLEGFTSMMVQEGVQYMEQRSQDDQPFLLVMSLIQVHTALHASARFKGKSLHGPYGDEIEEMDWSVGELVKALDTLDIADDTFVYFTSDNGGHVEEKGILGNREGGWNGIYRGGKGQGGMDGGIRVPTVARWPSVIPPGFVVDIPTSTMDILPTITSMMRGEIPSDRVVDGKDILPLLRGDQGVGVPHQFMVHYCAEQIHAARYTPGDGSDVYKVHFATPNWDPDTEGCGLFCDCHGNAVTWHEHPIMYNIARDPSERSPIGRDSPVYEPILGEIKKRLEHHRQNLEPVESQFWKVKVLPRPWLQPCCNFPTCTCEDEERSHTQQGHS